MAGLGGLALLGLAQGFNQYNKDQEDLQFLRQYRQEQLRGMQDNNARTELANQMQQQQMQQQQMDQQFLASYMAQQNGPDYSPQGANIPSGEMSPGHVKAAANPKSQGYDYSPANLDRLDRQNGRPAGTLRAFLSAENSGDQAVSPKGAVGRFQVLPTTAQKPGFGVAPFDPRDPEGVSNYVQALYNKSGGDMKKLAQYYNAGPGGNPNNKETQTYVPRFMAALDKYSKEGVVAPATQVAERMQAGGIPDRQVQQAAVQQQQSMADRLEQASQAAFKAGRFDLATSLGDKARAARAVEVQQRQIALKEQKDANNEVAGVINGVNGQESYMTALNYIRSDPTMAKTLQGLRLTGDYNQDRPQLEALKRRVLTVKDQKELDLRQQQFDINAKKMEISEKKANTEAAAAQSFDESENKRAEAAAALGIPMLPHSQAVLQAQTAKGRDAALKQEQAQAAKQLDQINTDAKRGHEYAQGFSRLLKNLDDLKTGPLNMITNNNLWTLDPKVAAFDKEANQIINDVQMSMKGNGASTAKMAGIIAKSKPSSTLPQDANRYILELGIAMGENALARSEFLNSWGQVNTDIHAGERLWERYEASQPAYTRMPDGTYVVNKKRMAWKDWLQQNGTE